MAIYLVTGKPRHGKTYFVIRSASHWIKRGERIYSNVFFDLKSKFFSRYYKKHNLSAEKILGDLNNPKDLANPDKQVFYWRSIRDWNKMTKGVIIADEGTIYFNPRKWASLSEETERKLMQHGHEDLDIWVTCQHYSRIDVSLRILAERILVVKKVLGGIRNKKRIWGVIRVTEHFLEDMERIDRTLDPEERALYTVYKQYFLIRRKYATLYDTRQMVGRSGTTDLFHAEQYCENDDCPKHGRKTGKPKLFHS